MVTNEFEEDSIDELIRKYNDEKKQPSSNNNNDDDNLIIELDYPRSYDDIKR